MSQPETSVAVQMFTLREHMKTPVDMARTLKRVSDMGWKAVQLSGHGNVEDAEMKKMVEDNGLFVCATHENLPKLLENQQAAIDKLLLWGCPNTAIGSMPKDYRPDRLPEFYRHMNEVGEKFKQAGIRFGYHNHSFEFQRLPDKRTIMQAIFEETDADKVTMEIDTYWVQHGGGDPAQYIRDYKGRVPFIHLKDMTVGADGPTFAEVGEGNLNWPSILDAAKEAGVEWYIVEQDRCERDPFESLKISLDNLQAMGLK